MYLKRMLLIALAVRLAGPCCADAADGAAQALDLKSGTWEIHLNVATSGMLPRLAPDTIQSLTATMTAEQRGAILADLTAREDEEQREALRGRDRIGSVCPLRQDFETRIEQRLPGEHCVQTLAATAQQLHLHRQCPASKGIPETEQDSDFERIDAENFSGTIRLITRDERTSTITESYRGYWRSASCSNPVPSPLVASDRTASQDPNRIVALIDGQSISARRGMELIDSAPPALRSRYEGRLSALLQRLYMQNAIVAEAARLHLDQEPPWQTELQNARTLLLGTRDDAGDAAHSATLLAQLQNARGKILWEAYFSQPPSQAARQALFTATQLKYRITVRDPEFFEPPQTP